MVLILLRDMVLRANLIILLVFLLDMVGLHIPCVLTRCHVACHFSLLLRFIWWHAQLSLASPLLTACDHIGTATEIIL